MIKNEMKKQALLITALCVFACVQPMVINAAQQESKSFWQNWKVIAGGASVLGATATAATYFIRKSRAASREKSLQDLSDYMGRRKEQRECEKICALDENAIIKKIEESPALVSPNIIACFDGETIKESSVELIDKLKVRKLFVKACAQNKLRAARALLTTWPASQYIRIEECVGGMIQALRKNHKEIVQLFIDNCLATRTVDDCKEFYRSVRNAVVDEGDPVFVDQCREQLGHNWPCELDLDIVYLDNALKNADVKKVKCYVHAGARLDMSSVLLHKQYEIAHYLLARDGECVRRAHFLILRLVQNQCVEGIKFLLGLPEERRPPIKSVVWHSLDASIDNPAHDRAKMWQLCADIDSPDAQAQIANHIKRIKDDERFRTDALDIVRAVLTDEKKNSLVGIQLISALRGKEMHECLSDPIRGVNIPADVCEIMKSFDQNPFVAGVIESPAQQEKNKKIAKEYEHERIERIDKTVCIDTARVRRMLHESNNLVTPGLRRYLDPKHGKVNPEILDRVLTNVGMRRVRKSRESAA